MSAIIVTNERGAPQAPPLVLARVQELLPGATLHAFKMGARGVEWRIHYPWPANDRRWARVQSGEIDPNYANDCISIIPLSVSVDEIASYLERGLTAMGDGYGYVPETLLRIRAQNRKATDTPWEKITDKAMEVFETNAGYVSPDVIKVRSAEIHNAPEQSVEKRTKKARRGKRSDVA